jgi:hypothetical protein
MKWRKRKPMPDYLPSDEERKWHKYCTDNNIIVSPMGIQNEDSKWKIGIAIGNHKEVHYSPHIYDKDTLWVSYYEMCKFYYDKYRR